MTNSQHILVGAKWKVLRLCCLCQPVCHIWFNLQVKPEIQSLDTTYQYPTHWDCKALQIPKSDYPHWMETWTLLVHPTHFSHNTLNHNNLALSTRIDLGHCWTAHKQSKILKLHNDISWSRENKNHGLTCKQRKLQQSLSQSSK
jgi:hypothetical protein